jgi:hypothetical protein
MFDYVLNVSRTIFSPTIIGFTLIVLYIFAWIRMEQLSELEDQKSSSPTESSKLFKQNSIYDIIANFRSKGKHLLKFGSICQPVRSVESPGVYWENEFIQIMIQPVIRFPENFELSIKDKNRFNLFNSLNLFVMTGAPIGVIQKHLIHNSENYFNISIDFNNINSFINLHESKFKRNFSIKFVEISNLIFIFDKFEIYFKNKIFKFENTENFFLFFILYSHLRPKPK